MSMLSVWLKRIALLLVLLQAAALQLACGYVAAGAAGAAIGHEIAEAEEEEDDD